MAAIAVLALVLIGPKQLPEVARILGRLLNDLRRSTNVFKEELKSQVQIDRQKIFDMTSEEERKRRQAAHEELIKPLPPHAADSPPQAEHPPASTPTTPVATSTDKPTDDKKS